MKQKPLYQLAYNYLKQEIGEKSLKEIYQYIDINNLYVFDTATPKHVLKNGIERKTINSNFSDKGPEFLFYKKDKKYGLLEKLSEAEKEKYQAEIVENLSIDEDSIEEIDEQLLDLISRTEKLEESTKSYLAFQQEYSNLQSLKQELSQVKQAFLNEKTVLFDKFQSKNNEHEEELKKIAHQFVSDVNHLNDSTQNKKDTFDSNIESLFQELNIIKQKAQEILKFSEQAGIAKYYEQKAGDKHMEAGRYLKFFIFSILSAFAISVLITLSEMNIIPQIGQGYAALTIKVTLYVPILLLSSFFWKLFIDTKRLFEVYDHKAILAKSISINQKILSDDNDMSKEQIIEKSTLRSLDSILETPFSTKNAEENTQQIVSILNELIKKLIK